MIAFYIDFYPVKEYRIHKSQQHLSERERDFINTMVGSIRANSTQSIEDFLAQNKDLVSKPFRYQGKDRTILEIAKLEDKPKYAELITKFQKNETKLRKRANLLSKLNA